MPSTIIQGETVNITLGVRNRGPWTVAGASIVDVIAPEFQIGTLPAGCTAVGNTVTCIAGNLATGENQDFIIPVTAMSPTAGTVVNSAIVNLPAGVTDPVPGNNTKDVSYEIAAPSSDLSLTKSKGPNPVAAGGIMTSTITVVNNGPSILTYDPANPLRIVDTVTANETFSSADAPWTCSQAGLQITCELTGPGTLAVGSNIALSLKTTAGTGVDMDLSNTACTGTLGGSGALPADGNDLNDCAGAGTRSTPDAADLVILKEVSLDKVTWTQTPAITVADNVTSFYIRLTVSNAGGNIARTVNVVDMLPNFLNSGSMITAVVEDSISTGSMSYTPSNGRLAWNLINLTVGAPQTLIVRVDRPFESGTFNNRATVSSPDTTETNTANNESTASYTIEAITDITLNAKSIAPNPARVGVISTYSISVRNLGPNPASDVIVTDTIDPARFELVGNPTTTKAGVTCTKNDLTGAIQCPMGTINRGVSYQISQPVRARFPFGGATTGFPISHTNTATVTTSTLETNTVNNSAFVIHDVDGPQMDLSIVKTEPSSAYDPVPYGSNLLYDVRVTNLGPSRASNIIITDTPAPPVGYTMTLAAPPVINPVAANGGNTLYVPPAPTCVPSGSTIVCRLHGTDDTQNYLDSRHQVIFRLTFAVNPADASVLPPTGPLTFANSVNVISLEQNDTTTVQADSQLANNTATQNTTIIPSTDLEVVSKTRITDSPVQINQPVEYKVVVRNNGPSPTTQIRVSDQLPTGWLSLGGETAVASGGVSITNTTCTGTNKVTCVLDGLFPGNGDTVTLTFFAKVADPFAGALNTNLTNTADIKPGLDGSGNEISRDEVPTNNDKPAVTQVTVSSIAGTVYRDDNLNDTIDSGEGLAGVTLTLTGTDDFNNVIATRTTTTATNGTFTFGRLPAGTYQIVENQPSGVFDRNETAGTAGGTVDNSDYSSHSDYNTIKDIVLPATTAATGYIFQEIGAARVSGYIYRDLNNNGTRDAGEAGFAPGAFSATPHVKLSGTDYAGNDINSTASVDANGAYAFTNVAPSGATPYIVTQLLQPNGASDGLDSNGIGDVVANSGGRPAPEDIVIGLVAPSANLTERNFGELPTSTLGGMVFLDPNVDATRNPTEISGLSGAILRLTGTDDLGQAIDCSITTTATGLYQFPNAADATLNCQVLRPGDYELEITPALGLTHTGSYVGSLGGTSNGVSGINTPSVGAGALRVTNIVVAAGNAGSTYDFGATGQGINGFVYIDRNASGVRDAGEAGIPGVTMTLSGTTASGQDVCTLINCAAVTDATGSFLYLVVPGSDANGYTLTQQAQNTAPLSNYADGLEALGDLGGTVGNDVISNIVLPTGGMGTNYSFGELSGSLSGSVFVDANDDGVRQPGEKGIEGVEITLSGTTKDGQDICAWRAALDPSLTCTIRTDANGNYSFEDMPDGNYNLIETHPGQYADGKEGVGSAGGTADNSVFDATAAANTISNITLAAGEKGTDYVFGERAVVIKGSVYKDIDRDGTRDPEDTPIKGVVIELYENGNLIATTTTDADGNYSFVDLPSGNYTIRETQPDGYGSSTPNEVQVNLTPGVEQSIDFGETVSTMAGHVFVDANNDGIRQTGEAPIEGVVVTLTGTDAAGNQVTRTATTNALGEWVIDDLLAGNYQLVETQPEGFSDGEDSAGSVGGTVEANADRIYDITLPVGTDATDYAFGERGQSLTGNVYVDVDGDGTFTPTDRPLGGVVVELRKPNGELVATTTTNPDGSYSFGNIRGGDYVVVEIQPDGYGNGRENPSNRVPVKIVSDQTPPVVNFGERTGSLSGLVYNDTNNNGVRDP
ncbi:SdrD B-like domain-containing protein, partial [Brevundimonas sp.]